MQRLLPLYYKKKYNMKRFALITLLCMLQGVALAQWSVGVHGGLTLTGVERSQAGRIDETYENLKGFDAGIDGNYAFNSWFSLRAQLDVMQRNHRMQRHLNYIHPVHTDHVNTYLTLPLMADFSFGNQRLRGHLLLGGYGAYWLNHRIKGTTYGMTDYEVFFNQFDEKSPFSSSDRRVDFGTVAGVGLSYGITDYIDLSLNAMYYYSLLSYYKGYPALKDYRYLNTASFTFGISYKIPQSEQQ